MSDIDALSAFARAFTCPDFRDRFIHEAIKKPEKVHERICHDIESLFDTTYRGVESRLRTQDVALCFRAMRRVSLGSSLQRP